MASKFRHHTTRYLYYEYLEDLYVIYLHMKTIEDRNPKNFSLISVPALPEIISILFNHFHTHG